MEQLQKQFVLETEQQGEYAFYGVLLGEASSQEKIHTHDGMYAPRDADRRDKCHGCRWLETRIYRADPDGNGTGGKKFVAHTIGRSRIPGEIDYARLFTTPSAFELVEMLTVRRKTPFLPLPSARALSQAAALDEDVKEAYVNRAVS